MNEERKPDGDDGNIVRGAFRPRLAECETAEAHGVVSYLSNILERAKRGEIVGVAIAGLKANGGTVSSWFAPPEGEGHAKLLGVVATLKFRMQFALTYGAEPKAVDVEDRTPPDDAA